MRALRADAQERARECIEEGHQDDHDDDDDDELDAGLGKHVRQGRRAGCSQGVLLPWLQQPRYLGGDSLKASVGGWLESQGSRPRFLPPSLQQLRSGPVWVFPMCDSMDPDWNGWWGEAAGHGRGSPDWRSGSPDWRTSERRATSYSDAPLYVETSLVGSRDRDRSRGMGGKTGKDGKHGKNGKGKGYDTGKGNGEGEGGNTGKGNGEGGKTGKGYTVVAGQHGKGVHQRKVTQAITGVAVVLPAPRLELKQRARTELELASSIPI